MIKLFDTQALQINKNNFFIFAFLFCNLFFFNHSLSAYSKANPTTGNSITVWQSYTSSTGFQISAAIQTGGVFAPSVGIATPATEPQEPLAAINSSNQIVAIWIGNDPILGSRAVYAAAYPVLGTWGAPVQVSSALAEQVNDSEYYVEVSNSGVIYIEWLSSLYLTGQNVRRASYSNIFGVFGAPVTIN